MQDEQDDRVNNEDHKEATDKEDTEEVTDNIIIYADDNTPTTADKDPLVLQAKTQKEVDLVTSWFQKNNMICSSKKTKLLVIGTHTNRLDKLTRNDMSLKIKVCGEDISDKKPLYACRKICVLCTL